jgi:uncharacterized membrane-anchored protein
MKNMIRCIPVSVAAAFFAAWVYPLASLAQDAPTAGEGQAQSESSEGGAPAIPGVEWKTEGAGDLGNKAEIAIPEGFVFTDASGTRTLMQLMQNPVSGSELGFLAPPDLSWFLVFEYDESGYVKDDEKDALDADAILSSIKEGQEHGNQARREKGWPELIIKGWFQEPRYNAQTNNLEWATVHTSEGQEGINYNTRLLGREGVMEVVLVGDPARMEEILPVYQEILRGYGYKEGHRYAEFRKGDKVAAYGLAALAAGGATVMAAKAGLLAKFWKVIVFGGLAVAAFFKKAWNGIRNLGTGGGGRASRDSSSGDDRA